jgi:hypothetical protein
MGVERVDAPFKNGGTGTEHVLMLLARAGTTGTGTEEGPVRYRLRSM